jgi:hypothetical protein
MKQREHTRLQRIWREWSTLARVLERKNRLERLTRFEEQFMMEQQIVRKMEDTQKRLVYCY